MQDWMSSQLRQYIWFNMIGPRLGRVPVITANTKGSNVTWLGPFHENIQESALSAHTCGYDGFKLHILQPCRQSWLTVPCISNPAICIKCPDQSKPALLKGEHSLLYSLLFNHYYHHEWCYQHIDIHLKTFTLLKKGMIMCLFNLRHLL